MFQGQIQKTFLFSFTVSAVSKYFSSELVPTLQYRKPHSLSILCVSETWNQSELGWRGGSGGEVSPLHQMGPSLRSRTHGFYVDSVQSVQLVTQSYLTLCDPTDCSMSGFPVLHHIARLAQTLVHRVSDAIQPSHPLSSPSPPTFHLSQHQSLSMSQFFTSGGKSIGASASALPVNIQD